MKNIFIIFTLCVFVASCSTQRHFTNKSAQNNYKTGKIVKGESTFFVSGLGQTDKIDAVAACGTETNINAVESKQSFINILLHIVTLSIYSPREYTIYCKN